MPLYVFNSLWRLIENMREVKELIKESLRPTNHLLKKTFFKRGRSSLIA